MASRAAKGDLVYIEPKSVKALQDLAKEFKQRGDGKALKKELNREIKAATKPLEAAIKANARGMEFANKGLRAEGIKRDGSFEFSSTRSRRTAGVTKTGRERRGKGLRQSLEQGVKTEVSYRAGPGAGVRIRLKSSDPEINQLGRILNRRGFIRHPLFGDTDHWFNTTARNGKDWFFSPVEKRRDDVVRGVKEAVDRMLNRLAKDIGR
jgi:hypothetical protein